MRILYLDLSPNIGGSVISLEQLLKRLDRSVFVPTLILAERSPASPRFRALGIEVIRVQTFTADMARTSPITQYVKSQVSPRRGVIGSILSGLWVGARETRNLFTRSLPLTWRLCRIMRSVRPDLLHINFIDWPAMAAAWLTHTPSICHLRALGPLGFWDRFWARTVRCFVFISECVAEDQVAQGIPRPKGRLIYNGVDLADFAPPSDSASEARARKTARARLGLPDDDRPLVAVVGRIVPWKGQDLFLRSLRKVADQVPNVLGLIVGDAGVWNQEYEAGLRALAAELGLEGNLLFTGYQADAPAVMCAVNILAHTSVEPEPFGRVMIEAMAASRPVVTPAEGGGREIVVHGETGLLYESRDADALASAISSLLNDPAGAEAMGRAGRARVERCFSIEQHVSAMSELYREIKTVLA